MVWGVEGESEEGVWVTSKNPTELYSSAKVSVVSALGFCSTCSTPITTFSLQMHGDLPQGQNRTLWRGFRSQRRHGNEQSQNTQTQELMWAREGTVAMPAPKSKLTGLTVIPENEGAVQDCGEFSLELLIHSCHVLSCYPPRDPSTHALIHPVRCRAARYFCQACLCLLL